MAVGTAQESRLAIVIDTKGAEERIKELRKQLAELGGQADDTTNSSDSLNNANGRLAESSSKLSKAMGLAAKAAKYGAAAIGGLAVAAIKVSGDFEEAMNGVRAVSGATGKDFDDLRELAKKMGAETAFSATEAANGMEYLAMAGLNTEQILATIPNALNLAAAGNIDLASSADILSNIMTGMGISADESGRAADVLAQTAAAANVDVKMLGESMKYAAPIAKQLGLSLEDTAASMGILGNAGIQGGEAGTALRAIYTRLATHKKSKEWFDALGLSVTDASGNMKGMITILKELQAASKDMSAQDRLEIYKDTVGAEAMSALGVTMDSISDGSLDTLIGKLGDAEGAAKRMADIRMEGLNGAIKTAKSAAEGFLIALGDSGLLNIAARGVSMLASGISQLSAMLPQITADITAFFQKAEVATAMEMAIEGLQTVWGNLVSVIKATGDVIAPVVEFFREHDKLSEALAISIGLVGGAFVIYNAAVVIGTAVTAGFVAVLALLTSPITLTIAALVALTAAGVYVYQNWDMIKAKATEVWGSITKYIGDKVAAIKNYFTTNFPAMSAIVGGSLKIMGTMFSSGFALIKNTVTTVMDVIKAVISGDFKAIPGIIWNGLKAAAGIVTNMMSNILNIIKNTGIKLFEVGKQLVQGLINGIKSSISGVTNAISDMASSAVAKAKSVLDIHSPSRVMKKVGENTAQGMADGIKKGARAVKTEAQKMAEDAVKAVRDGIAGVKKEIALFGNSSRLAEFDYDVKIGKYKGASNVDLSQFRQLIAQMEAMTKASNDLMEAERQRNTIINDAASYDKAIYDLQASYNTAARTLVFEIEHISGKYKDLSENVKNVFKEAAAALDEQRILATFRDTMNGFERQMALMEDNSLFAQWSYDLNDASNVLSTMDDTLKNRILNRVAELGIKTKNLSMQDTLKDLQRQIELTRTIDDVERSNLEIEHERKSVLESIAYLKEMGLDTDYQQLAAGAQAVANAKMLLVATTAQQTASKSIRDALEGIHKEIALFGNTDAMAEFNYELDVMKKYAGASAEQIERLRAAFETLQALKAGDAFGDLLKRQDGSSESPVGRLVEQYKNDLKVIEDFERNHVELLENSAAAKLQVEKAYQRARATMIVGAGEEIFGSVSSIMKDMAGEKSKAYKAMFAVEKGFAIASSILNIQAALASATASLPFPLNLPVIATVAAEGAAIVSSIKAVSSAGFKSGGYTGGMGVNDVAGVVHGQEYVFDAQATKRIGVDNLNAMRSGQSVGGDVQVNIINNSSARVTASDDGKTITIEDVRNENKRSWSNLSNPNSFESKQLNRNIQAPRRR